MVKPVAFFLPQYHPIRENDEWWGAGFTEWRNVAKAVPNFVGHYQPHLPSELGFYDLRLVDVQRKQAELAKTYGIYGFCYYYYWFNGRRVLERPLNQVLENPDIDLPFCVCWANENWTRTWDGKANDVLLAQAHSPEDDEAFLRSLLPLFRDPRYIKVDGKPMLLVYRVDLFPDMRATADRWRAIAEKEGFPGLHLCAVQFYGVNDPRPWGFDAAVEFPPHQFIGPENRPDVMPQFTNPRFQGGVVDYQKVAAQALRKPPVDYEMYRGVVPSWDNTARRQDTPHLLLNSSPLDYQHWLQAMVEQTRVRLPPERQFVFINAWNEWGEGCHLEPDVRYGRAYLEATHAALNGKPSLHPLFEKLRGEGASEAVLSELERTLESRNQSLYALQDVVRRKNEELERFSSRPQPTSKQFLREAAKLELNRFPRVKALLKGVRDRLSTR